MKASASYASEKVKDSAVGQQVRILTDATFNSTIKEANNPDQSDWLARTCDGIVPIDDKVEVRTVTWGTLLSTWRTQIGNRQAGA